MNAENILYCSIPVVGRKPSVTVPVEIMHNYSVKKPNTFNGNVIRNYSNKCSSKVT
jgi:hypothetical protein